MGEHHALRHPGGARRVDDRRHVVGLDLHDRRFAAFLRKSVERLGSFGRIERDDAGHLAAHLGDLVGVLHEDRLRPRVLEDVRALVGGKRGVDGDVGHAEQLAGEVRDVPFDPVVRKDRDAVAADDAARRERAGAGPDATGELFGRHGVVDALGLLEEAVGPLELLDTEGEDFGQRGGFRGHSPVYHERVV
jgi:hypothetical protein